MSKKILSKEQSELVAEFVATYNLSEEQISFDGNSTEPIFDYEALNVLRLRLTDLQDTDPWIAERNETLGIVTAKCTVTLADGRTASDLGSAQLGEVMPDGGKIENFIQAQNVALARALRRGIRSAGVNLLKAHKQFLQTGEIVSGAADEETLSKIGREIHALAAEWGHIKGKDKSDYQSFIENVFGTGKRSTLDLNDIEKSQLANMYRQMLNSRNIAGLELPKAA